MKAIETLQQFEELNQELVYFLAELNLNEWLLQSHITGHTVKDMASHLLRGSLQRISMQRDHFFDVDGSRLQTHPDLLHQAKLQNEAWILATSCLSPRLLLELIKKYEQEVFELYRRLKSDEASPFPLAWAGREHSPNWMDIAGVYARKWTLQMQMRMATGRTLLMSERFLTPYYETVLLGLPFKLDSSELPTTEHLLEIEITGELRLRKRLQQKDSLWNFTDINNKLPDTVIKIPASIGWLLFTNTDRNRENVLDNIIYHGDNTVITCVLNYTAALS
jgi:hypothetical protein